MESPFPNVWKLYLYGYIYAHTGKEIGNQDNSYARGQTRESGKWASERVGAFNSVSGDGTIYGEATNEGDDNTLAFVCSGNDITFKKYKAAKTQNNLHYSEDQINYP